MRSHRLCHCGSVELTTESDKSLRRPKVACTGVRSESVADRSMGPLQLGASCAVQHTRMMPALHCQQPGSARAAAVDQHGEKASTLPGDEVPIVDLTELRSCGHAQATQRVAAACRDWGFFQVVNHGVPMEFVHELRKQCLDVYSLPREQKDKVSRRTQGSRWGYDFRPDHGPLEVLQLNAWDSRQFLCLAHELVLNSSDDFIAVYEEANLVFRTLAIEILDILIQGLRVDAKHFQAHKNESQGVMRANYYHRSKSPDQVIGLIPHVDGNLFTILHQQDVSGLEVLKDGRWIPITLETMRSASTWLISCRCSQTVNTGASNIEQWRPRHRRASPLTLAEGVSLVPAPELVDSRHPPLYRPFTWADFVEASKGAARPYPSVLPFFEQGYSSQS